MNRRIRPRGLARTLTLFLTLISPVALTGAEGNWHPFAEGRWKMLEAAGNGKTGFTLLAPADTGLAFTNDTSEAAKASNRVLLNGSGVATGDFDHDGRPDIFLCSLTGENKLYRNLGQWRFEDVTAAAGLAPNAHACRGAVFADLNGDGWPDLLVATLGGGVECFFNDARGHFIDASAATRTRTPFAATTLALADVDGNGTLDLYVANNRTDDLRDRGQVDLKMVQGKMVVPANLAYRLTVTNGQIYEFGEPDILYLNDGQGHFTPSSWITGRFLDEDGQPLQKPPLDWGLTASFRDLNGDGHPDLYVCNDFWTPDRVWLNDGRGNFRAAPRLAVRNMCSSSMGVDFADIDRDGVLDFFVVDMRSRDPRARLRQRLAQMPAASPVGAIEDRPEFMRNTLYVGRGDGTFAEIANLAGVAASEWSWSPVFLDVDLDGYPDLLITSGHARDVQDSDAEELIRSRQHSWKGFTNEVERQKAFSQELLEHMRLYPLLATPIVAFRNRGDLRFDDMTALWGTDAPAVHHAIALADFDGDGDIDLVVNNLGSPAGLYRNNTVAPRVAIRLRGLPPNTDGIGAKLVLRGGATPLQSEEVLSGGRYMAGSEPLIVFAAGSLTNSLTLEVHWRTGKRTIVRDLLPQRLYEISEAGATAPSSAGALASPAPAPLFTDVSPLIQHTHHEELFNDFERQPLLPRRLSQLGPGVAWFDVDGDGWDDLVLASGKGGRLACFQNDTHGGFRPRAAAPFDSVATRDQTGLLGVNTPAGRSLLVGSASYEDGATNLAGVLRVDVNRAKVEEMPWSIGGDGASVGPLAQADVDGDGDLDLFVGGRVVPGRYPEAASSHLYRRKGGHVQEDAAAAVLLQEVGLVSGALWSDLDGDGYPELVLACEWGPLKIYHNEKGQLRAWNPSVRLSPEARSILAPESAPDRVTTLADWKGWWNSVAAIDLDGDGRMDLVAGNWGLNSEYAAHLENPLPCYYGDFMQRGLVNVLECDWDPITRTPTVRRRLDALNEELPSLRERFHSHREFSEAALEQVLQTFATKPRRVEITTLASVVLLNRGDHFEARPLPREAQWAPAFALCVADFDGDGHEDLFVSQNFFANTPEMPRLDAGRGLMLLGSGNGQLQAMTGARSGIAVYGEQRGAAVADYDGDGRPDLVVTQNGAATRLFRNASGKAGLRVHLQGPAENPDGIGAVMRLKAGSTWGAAREIHAGSGYWSQDSAVTVLGWIPGASELWVRWPGGGESTVPVRPDAKDLIVRAPAAGK